MPDQPGTGRWPGGDPRRACLISDFDGVLSPMVADPTAAAIDPAVAEQLAAVVPALGRVAVVSGRPARFLLERVTIPGIELVGLYGLERVVDGEVQPHPLVEPHVEALAEAKAALAHLEADWPGVWLEDKGLAVGLHWRRAEEPSAAAAAVTASVHAAAGALAVEDGKMVIELRPPVAIDKGSAVADLAAGFDQVAYLGDDVGDLPAFAEVTRRGGPAVAVDHGAETDPRVLEAASTVIDGVDGTRRWLAALAARIG